MAPMTENVVDKALALIRSAVDADGYARTAARLYVSEQTIRRYYAYDPKKPKKFGNAPADTTARRIIEALTKK